MFCADMFSLKTNENKIMQNAIIFNGFIMLLSSFSEKTEFSILVCHNEPHLQLIDRAAPVKEIISVCIPAVQLDPSASEGETRHHTGKETIILHIVATKTHIRIHYAVCIAKGAVSVKEVIYQSEVATPVTPIVIVIVPIIVSVISIIVNGLCVIIVCMQVMRDGRAELISPRHHLFKGDMPIPVVPETKLQTAILAGKGACNVQIAIQNHFH